MFSTEISINLAPNSALVPENDILFLRGPVTSDKYYTALSKLMSKNLARVFSIAFMLTTSYLVRFHLIVLTIFATRKSEQLEKSTEHTGFLLLM